MKRGRSLATHQQSPGRSTSPRDASSPTLLQGARAKPQTPSDRVSPHTPFGINSSWIGDGGEVPRLIVAAGSEDASTSSPASRNQRSQNRGQIVTASEQAEEGDECIHGVIGEGDGPDVEKKEEEIVGLFGQLWSIPNPIPKSS